MKSCWRCEASSICPFWLPGAGCIYETSQPNRSPSAAAAIRRAHHINWAALAGTAAALIAVVVRAAA